MVFLAEEKREQVLEDLQAVAQVDHDVASRLARHIGVSPPSQQLFPWPTEKEDSHSVTVLVKVTTYGKRDRVRAGVMRTVVREMELAFGTVEVTLWDE